MDKEFTHGQTEECIMDDSIMENNMAKVYTGKVTVKKFMVYG